MNIGTIILIVIMVLIVLILLYVASTYNKLVHLRNLVKDQWAQIDVLLKRRADLIPKHFWHFFFCFSSFKKRFWFKIRLKGSQSH